MLSFVQTIFRFLTLSATVFLILFYIRVDAYQSVETGIVKADKLNIRQEAERTSRIVKTIYRGTYVEILEHQNGWLKISFGGDEGYIRNRARYVRILETEEDGQQDQSKMPQYETEAKNISRKIEKYKTEVVKFNEKEFAIISNLDDLEMELNKLRLHVASLKKELRTIDEKISKNNEAIEEMLESISDTEDYIAGRLVALYKMKFIGRMNVLASADSIFDLFNRKFALEKILEHDEKILQDYKNKKATLRDLSERFRLQKKEKISLEENCNKQIKALNRQRTQRKKLLEDVRNKKALGLASLESLKQAAIALDQAILSLHVEPKDQNKDFFKKFENFKGLLPMPVKGKIVSFFGPYKNAEFNIVNFCSGVEIKADMGEPIRAVMGGQVLYSNWFKNYGNMIIIDHGRHYYTLYAHAEELFKSKGELVEPDEVIATVGDTASMKGANLYFEIRHHGKPIDPLKWLKKG